MASGWKYILARSDNRETIQELREANDRTLQVDRNKSGQATLWLPLKDKASSKAWPWSTCIIAQFDDEPIWSGPVLSRNRDLEGNRASITAVGWFERLMHLLLPDPTTAYGLQDAGLIIEDLLAKARAIDPTLPITMGDIQASQDRSITYGLDQSIGQAIIDFGSLEAGVDWWIDPITLQLNVSARKGNDLKNVRWTYIGDGKSDQSNLSNVIEDVDGSTVVNDFFARGNGGTGYEQDPFSKENYGVIQESQSLADVSDVNVLVAFAAGEIIYRSNPRVTYTLTPKSTSKVTVPRFKRNFDIGDTTYLLARKDGIDTTTNGEGQAVRVFAVSLSINNQDTETITSLQTYAG